MSTRPTLQSAAALEVSRLAALFTAAYEDYFVPFAIDEATLRFMVAAYDLDLEASRIALLDGVPVGLANLGVREERGWIGGIGVVPFARRRGVAQQLMQAVLSEARRRGVREVVLEVLEQNEPALRLYETLGFELARGVEVWVLDSDPGAAGDARASSLDAAHARIVSLRTEPEPWQRSDETLAYLRTLDPPPQAVAVEGGAAIFRQAPQAVSVVQIAGDAGAARHLLALLRRHGAVNVLNLPAGDAAADALRDLGGRVAVRQRELVLAL